MPVSPELVADLAASVVEQYAEAERVLLARIARALGQGLDAPDWAERKLLEIQLVQARARAVVTALEKAAGQSVAEALLTAWNRGSAVAAADLASVLERALGDVVDPLPGNRAVTRLVAEATQLVTATGPRILRAADDIYRQVVADTASQVLLGTQTRREAAQAALDRFAAKGVVGFVDTAGRGWNLASYVEMAVRTSTAKAAVAAHTDRLVAVGQDLVIVSNAPQECRLCRPWEGKVLSLTGATAGTIDGAAGARVAGTLADAVADGLFHPGCRHSTGIYLPGVTKPLQDTEDPVGDAARQRLRLLERRLREAKRRQVVALDEPSRRRAGVRVRDLQGQIRDHVESTPAKRQRQREQIGSAR